MKAIDVYDHVMPATDFGYTKPVEILIHLYTTPESWLMGLLGVEYGQDCGSWWVLHPWSSFIVFIAVGWMISPAFLSKIIWMDEDFDETGFPVFWVKRDYLGYLSKSPFWWLVTLQLYL
jgi:hypothetical protein